MAKPREYTEQETQEIIDYIREYFRYDRGTGKLYWKKKPNRKIRVGQEAGSINKVEGYRLIQLNGVRYVAHRLVWLIETGRLPFDQLDHINHNRDDNRIINLRLVLQGENHRNKSKQLNNISGVTGVSWYKPSCKWRAHIGVKGEDIYLGSFTEKEDAICARKSAEVKYGFHENHGI